MKVTICGKGGCGKSTITSLLEQLAEFLLTFAEKQEEENVTGSI